MLLLLRTPSSPSLPRRLSTLSSSRRVPMQAPSPLSLSLVADLTAMKAAGTYKTERVIVTPQSSRIAVATSPSQPVLNMCANNYLGLANHPNLIAAAKAALDSHGFGMASVRFICGTQDLHKKLEARIAAFHGTEDAILFPSCFDANAGIFEAILSPEDAVISDEKNHASIIDGIRLCKAQRLRYKNRDMADLEAQLIAAKDARIKLIVTDGVFSMDGTVAPLAEIVALAKKYGASTFIDECHATGFFGKTGRGTDEHTGTQGKIDIINSTLGKAMGGATGGYTAGSKELVDVLRNKARPYLFSNSVAPAIVGASLAVFDMLEKDSVSTMEGEGGAQYLHLLFTPPPHSLSLLPIPPSYSQSRVAHLRALTHRFRDGLTALGFTLSGDYDHPICPVMLGDARLAAEFADDMLKKGVYVIGFSYPVVPKGAARIRTQISSALTEADIDFAIKAFGEVGRERGIIKG